MPDTPQQRFLKLDQVGEELNITANQVYALVRRGDLVAIKIGGRGQWRVERDRLEEYIERLYAETRAFIEAHPIQEDTTPELGIDEARDQLISGGAASPKTKDASRPARPGASSHDSMPAPVVEAPPRSASLAERARSRVENDTALRWPTEPGVAQPDPAPIHQPGRRI